MNDADLANLLDEFKRAHEAGERPDPAEFLAQAGDAAGDLADLLDAYLAVQVAPAPSPAELDRMAADPLFAPPRWGQILEGARERCGVLRADVVTRLTAALGLRLEQGTRVQEHLHNLETGALSPAGVSEQVVSALDEILGGIGAALERTRHVPSALFAGEPRFARDAEGEVEVPRYQAESDPEVDRFFLG